MLQPNPSMQSGHAFSRVPQANVNRSAFDRSHRVGTTFDAGWLIPIWTTYAFPGDTVSAIPAFFARIATLIRPFMDRGWLDVHSWFIPFRLVDENWERLMGQQDNPGDSISFTVPQVAWTTPSPVTLGSLYDYLRWPYNLTNVSLSAYKPRAYALLKNTWYRDQNLEDSVPFSKGVGPDDPADYVLQRRGKRHDYFTSALPFPQKGNAVSVPISLTAPVTGIAALPANRIRDVYVDTGGVGAIIGQTHQSAAGYLDTNPGSTTVQDVALLQPSMNIPVTGTATLTAAAGFSINEFRISATLQQYLEISARGGTYYPEVIRAHFGVSSPDARLQRPEFLGGGTIPLNVHQVEMTAESTAGNPGDLAAFGVIDSTGKGLGFTQSFTEHGLIMMIISVRFDYTYFQGVPREDRYLTREDFYVPTFANLGEQTIRKQEIYAQGGAVDNETWGWQERWAEMRYQPSALTGLMRPGVPGSLGDVWTVAQTFASLPGLDQDFILENPPLDRVIAVPTEPHFVLDGYIHQRSVRAMPLYSVPGLTRI